MQFINLFIVLLLAGCVSQQANKPTEKMGEPVVEAKEEIPFSKRVYFLQHKLIPKWVFNSDGVFYDELSAGNYKNFILKSAEVVGSHYAHEMIIESIKDKQAVLISFPLPEKFANCYFVLVQKNKNGFSYYTYEKTFNFDNGSENYYGVVGGWDKAGSHSNFGPRSYKEAQKFVDDVLN